MGPDANVRKLTVASVVAAADAVLKERSTPRQRPEPARSESRHKRGNSRGYSRGV